MVVSNSELIQLFGVIVNSIIAFFALYQVRIIRKEIHILEKQAVFERLQIYPIINIMNYDTDVNHIVLKLKNDGKGIATKLAIQTMVFPLKVINNDLVLMEDNALKIIEEDTRNTIIINPIRSAIFLKNEYEKFTLYPNIDEFFSSEIVVGFKYSDKGWKWYSFNELKQLFNYNKIRYGVLSISLAYQDFTENITEIEGINTLIIDFSKHNTFSEVFTDNNKFHRVTVGIEDIPFHTWESYVGAKSQRHFLDTDLFK